MSYKFVEVGLYVDSAMVPQSIWNEHAEGYFDACNICKELGISEHTGWFILDGNIHTLLPERTTNPIQKEILGQTVFMVAPKMSPAMFDPAQHSPEELLSVYKEVLKDANIAEDFDWWSHLVLLDGTVMQSGELIEDVDYE